MSWEEIATRLQAMGAEAAMWKYESGNWRDRDDFRRRLRELLEAVEEKEQSDG